MERFTHLDETGAARMVDVSGKDVTRVVRADVDTGEGHQHGEYGCDDSPTSVGEQKPDATAPAPVA